MTKESGFALPLVLGITTILVVIVISISTSVSHKITLMTELDSRTRADMKTYSAFNEVMFYLATSTFTSMDLIIPPDMELDKKAPMGTVPGITLWNLFGVPISLKEGVTVTLRDAAGMVSFFANPKLLERSLARFSADTDHIAKVMDRLADWQDNDDFMRINGAEAWEYRQAGYAYGPRNAPLQCVEEVRLIMGMNDSMFDRIRPEIMYWASGNINYLTMSESLLRVILQDDRMTDQILQLRRDRQLSGSLFTTITGLHETEYNFFYPSGLILVEITGRVDQSTDRIQTVVSKKGSRNRPFTIMEWVR